MTSAERERARRLLLELHASIRDRLLRARTTNLPGMAKVAAVTAADTIYAIDRVSEAVIARWFASRWPANWPVQIVMEGIEDGEALTFPRGTPVERTRFRCIIDPIDGTRNLMYDKRSAWVLTGLAPQRHEQTTIADIEVAVMTELPTSKQWRSDQISAVRGGGRRGVRATAHDVLTGRSRALTLQPSRARDFKHGFASFVRFFPDGKTLTAEIEEALWRTLHGRSNGASPVVFDDQYISTGGQLYELLAGHDRMIGDLRPLVFAKLGIKLSLTCHPYDICTELILREAGGVVETPDGRPVQVPLDTTTPVAWIGYANTALARQVRPVLRRLIRKYL